jgi:hypothetical protein
MKKLYTDLRSSLSAEWQNSYQPYKVAVHAWILDLDVDFRFVTITEDVKRDRARREPSIEEIIFETISSLATMPSSQPQWNLGCNVVTRKSLVVDIAINGF